MKPMLRTHLDTAAVFLLAGGLLAQAPGLERMYRWLPAQGPCVVSVVGDVNGDGLVDVVFGPNRSTGDVWLGGDARLQRHPQAMPYYAEYARALVLADFDGDGDLDVAMANEVPAYSSSSGMVRVLRNDGTGRFVASGPGTPLPSPTTVLAAADMDTDGDVDLVVGRAVWRNNGTGSFQANAFVFTSPGSYDATNAVTLADLDGDGDADAYFSNLFQPGYLPTTPPLSQDRVYRNDGQGVFTEVAAPSVVNGQTTLHTRACDFDLDGDLDLAQVTRSGALTHAWRLLRNDGALAFSQVWWQSLASNSRIEVASWNLDGRPDVAIYTGAYLLALVQLWPLNFAPASLPTATVASPLLLDFDQDQDTDYVEFPTVGNTDLRLVRNVGNSWVPAPAMPSTALPQQWYFDMADVNGDGALDIVWAPTTASTGRILLGDGDGAFTAAAAGDFGLQGISPGDLECGDIDGDGDPDILFGAYQSPVVNPPTSRLFRNVNGLFVNVPFPAVYGQFVRLSDLDGDADLDAVLVGYGTITVATNDGSGSFQSVPGSVPFNAYDPKFAHLADFDGDGDPDLIVEYGSSGTGTWLFRNIGNAMFQANATTLPFGLQCATDLDGDGDVDLLGASAAGTPMLLHRNTGSGTFVTQPFPALPGVGLPGSPFLDRKILPEDLDHDGRIDLVVADPWGQWQGTGQSMILWNQGWPNFTAVPSSELPVSGLPSGFFDFDTDGDRDLVLVAWQPTFVRSIHRHLAPRSLPRIGHLLDLDVRGRAAEPFILGFALARTWLSIPGYGALRLEPGSLQIAALGAFDAAGQAAFSAAVPNAPSLVGLALHWQALSGATPRLGNLLTTQLQAH
ncbi:MAG: VCBS repeat-containing protein [Planctomycetota bacterium]